MVKIYLLILITILNCSTFRASDLLQQNTGLPLGGQNSLILCPGLSGNDNTGTCRPIGNNWVEAYKTGNSWQLPDWNNAESTEKNIFKILNRYFLITYTAPELWKIWESPTVYFTDKHYDKSNFPNILSRINLSQVPIEIKASLNTKVVSQAGTTLSAEMKNLKILDDKALEAFKVEFESEFEKNLSQEKSGIADLIFVNVSTMNDAKIYEADKSAACRIKESQDRGAAYITGITGWLVRNLDIKDKLYSRETMTKLFHNSLEAVLSLPNWNSKVIITPETKTSISGKVYSGIMKELKIDQSYTLSGQFYPDWFQIRHIDERDAKNVAIKCTNG